jgi:hypothetical protein
MFIFPDTLVANFRIQLLKLLTNLSEQYCIPYEDAAFAEDVFDLSSDLAPIEFLTQSSYPDAEDMAETSL